jgi:hypothetical protein
LFSSFAKYLPPVPILQHGHQARHIAIGGRIMLETVARKVGGQDHSEGRVARAIEQQTAKLPSDTFLWAALGSIGLSLGLQLMDKKEMSNFVGHWAPTILIMGLYNKLVKLEGSD